MKINDSEDCIILTPDIIFMDEINPIVRHKSQQQPSIIKKRQRQHNDNTDRNLNERPRKIMRKSIQSSTAPFKPLCK
jgi:hypothetical protein